MMLFGNKVSAAALLSLAGLLAAADNAVPFNLIPEDRFTPVIMHGEAVGPRGWMYADNGRVLQRSDPKIKGGYLDGRECFRLEFDNGVFTMRYTDKVFPEYYTKTFAMSPRYCSSASIPAEALRFRGTVKLDKGAFTPYGGRKLLPSEDWQTFDYVTRKIYFGRTAFVISPAKNMTVSMKDFSITPVYSKIGGTVNLPDGGKLTKLVMPADASYLFRRSVHLWRGWLWKLTGTALPVIEKKEAKAESGALVFMKGDAAPGGYVLHIGKNGGTLTVSDDFAVTTALFNCLRRNGAATYSRYVSVIPARNPAFTLKAVDEVNKPKFRLFRSPYDLACMEELGGVNTTTFSTWTPNWYSDFATNEPSHVALMLLPKPDELTKHPDWLMMHRNGKRQTLADERKAGLYSPCLTNPDAVKFMLDRYSEWHAGYDGYVSGFALGDHPDSFCSCPSCRAANRDKTHSSYASVMFDFINRAAARIGKDFPGRTVSYCAYQNYTTPPDPASVKPSSNLDVDYCMTRFAAPCLVHADCELNQKAFSDLEKWKKIVGRDRIGIVFYDRRNPFMFADMLDRLSGYFGLYAFAYDRSEINQYLMARWNQGEKAEKIIEDFNNAVYGKGGKFVTEAQRIIYEHDKQYRHTKENLSAHPHGHVRYPHHLPRWMFDKVYAVLDKGLAAVKGDSQHELPLMWEKFEYLVVDLYRFPRSNFSSDADLKAFALRVSELVRLADRLGRSGQYPYTIANGNVLEWQVPIREFMRMYCGLDIPNEKKLWTDEDIVKKIMKDPVRFMTSEPEKRRGFIHFSAMNFRGGEQSGDGVILRRGSSGKGRVSAVFTLERIPAGSAAMIVSGYDDEKPGKTSLEVLVNGRRIFAGADLLPDSNAASENRWVTSNPGNMTFVIPEGMLQKGENVIEFVNTAKDNPARMIRRLANPSRPEDGMIESEDYYWGWIAIRDLSLVFIGDEWTKFLGGEKSAWSVWKEHKPQGTVTVNRDRTVTIVSKGGVYTGISVPTAEKWLLPKNMKFRIRLKASGKGAFAAGIICYPATPEGKRHGKYSWSSIDGKLTEEPKTFEKTVTQAEFGFCVPVVFVKAGGAMKIDEFSCEPAGLQ